MVFNDNVMKERLPKDTYKSLQKTILEGKYLDLYVANVVAEIMKNWAVEKGATHFSHWFQPMTGITAEKHDSFAEMDGTSNIILKFSGESLVKGESDASSFPTGGLRLTFEARGYTAWDPTSYSFIRDNTLYIPTAFCAYNGGALDKKTPLLSSMEALDFQSKRILKLFGGEKIKRVFPTVGTEQEYFLIDKKIYEKRPDLINCNRTLFGASPQKGQELNDHYFGAIKPRVKEFMRDLDNSLWELGVLSKTKHNETAPSQHELALAFSSANIASDQNQLTMELMQNIALKYDLVCLLHEKPFKGINGSGKHNNWSLSTNTGVNLFDPGETPYENAQFLLFLTAVIKAVDEYQELLRLTVATAGNDHRLGMGEAPPAIISIFLGDELTEILNHIEGEKIYNNKNIENIEIGVHVLPNFPKDSTDRNRTSPFAFTGNRFEFRMVGSSSSISGSNIILNTIVAEILKEFADKLESSTNFKEDLNILIRNTIKKHKRIIYNGNNYSKEWIDEAKKRGLSNLKSTPEALPYFIESKNIKVFEAHNVFSKEIVHSRYEILAQDYCKKIKIEGLTISNIIKKYIIPNVLSYEKFLCENYNSKKETGLNLSLKIEEELLFKISELNNKVMEILNLLENNILEYENKDFKNVEEKMIFSKNKIFYYIEDIQQYINQLEKIVAKDYWTMPTYSEILFSID